MFVRQETIDSAELAEQKAIAAADLADHYITLLLTHSPRSILAESTAVELTAGTWSANFQNCVSQAQAIVELRQQLINGFSNQPLPGADE